MKKCSKSLVIREMQSKTILRYHLTPCILANMTAKEGNGVKESWRGCGKIGILMHCWQSCESMQPFWRAIWNYAQRAIKDHLSFNPAIPLLGIYPKRIIGKTNCTKNQVIPQLINGQGTMNRQFSDKEIKIINKHTKKCSKSLIIREMQLWGTTLYLEDQLI